MKHRLLNPGVVMLIVFLFSLSAIANTKAIPTIKGVIDNISPNDGALFVVDNQITVPNSFPSKVTSDGTFSVSPDLPNPYIKWTKRITYKNSQGDGCSAAFGWNSDTKSSAANVIPISTNSECDVSDDGAVIYMGTND